MPKNKSRTIQSAQARKQVYVIKSKSIASHDDIMDNIINGVYEINAHGDISFLNRVLTERPSIQPGQHQHLHYLDFFDQKYHSQAKKNFKRVMRSKDGIPVELKYKDSTGQIRIVEVHSRPIRENGKVVGLLGISRDITEHKQTEEVLRASQDLFLNMINAMPDVIVQTDMNGEIVFVNDMGIRLFGYSDLKEVTGKNILSFIAPGDRIKAGENVLMMLEQKLGPREYQMLTKDGQCIHIEVNGDILRHEDGSVYGRIHVCREITERKKMEERLWATQERLRLAHQAGKLGYYDWDIQNDHLYYSDQYIEILEYGRDEFEPRIRSWKKLIHPQDKTAVLHALKNHIDGKTSHYEATYRLKVKSGAWRWFREHAKVVNRDTKGSPLSMIGTITDVTPYKEFEKELEKKVEERTVELVEVNSALKILLKRREQDKEETEETMAANLKFMVLPYLHKLKRSALNVQQKEWVSLINENLNKISAPFIKKLSSKYSALTPKEIQVAECIRSGKTSKEIAEMMNISARTVDVLRYSVRKKLGLNNKKVNLQSLLSSL